MTLIACPECSSDVSDKAPACPRCGVPIFRESRLIVVAPVQAFLFSPTVQVFWDGEHVAALRKGDRFDMAVESDGEAEFATGNGSVTLAIRAGEATRVQLAWDRMRGRLMAQVVDSIVSGHSNV